MTRSGRALCFWEALNNLNLLRRRRWMTAAAKDAAANDSAKPAADKALTKEQAESLKRYYEVFEKRREFLSKVAQRDSQLALDMLRSTRQQPPTIGEEFRLPGENDLEQEIAQCRSGATPRRALQIARESLAKGISFQLISLLNHTKPAGSKCGVDLARDIIAKLDSEDLGSESGSFGGCHAVTAEQGCESRAPAKLCCRFVMETAETGR